MTIKIDLIRHADAIKYKGMDDFYRTLSPEGVQKSLNLRKNYVRRRELMRIKLALHSPAPRASCTIAYATAGSGAVMVPVHELWIDKSQGQIGTIIDQAFEEYGYDISRYSQEAEVYDACRQYGRDAAGAVFLSMKANGRNLDDGDIVVAGGHAVLLNFVADALSNGKWSEQLECCKLAPTGVLRLTMEDLTVTDIRFPRG